MMVVNNRNVRLNQYAMEQRIAGKLFREIGEELGVGVERARQRVYWGFRYSGKYERDKNATTMGDLFISERLKNIIKGIPADHMTFDEFLENFSQQKLMDTENFGKMCVKELAETLRNKNVSEEKISAWLNVKIKKVKKVKKKRCDAGIPNGPEEKHDTCQRYVIAEGRLFMGSLCNEPLLPRQKKYCTKHKGNQS
jgi:predicted DNA binding CopG/RHH family protein